MDAFLNAETMLRALGQLTVGPTHVQIRVGGHGVQDFGVGGRAWVLEVRVGWWLMDQTPQLEQLDFNLR